MQIDRQANRGIIVLGAVDAGSTIVHIGAGPAEQNIVTIVADQSVFAGAAVQSVVAGAAGEGVVTGAPGNSNPNRDRARPGGIVSIVIGDDNGADVVGFRRRIVADIDV